MNVAVTEDCVTKQNGKRVKQEGNTQKRCVHISLLGPLQLTKKMLLSFSIAEQVSSWVEIKNNGGLTIVWPLDYRPAYFRKQ